jgi:hypothetical protein
MLEVLLYLEAINHLRIFKFVELFGISILLMKMENTQEEISRLLETPVVSLVV